MKFPSPFVSYCAIATFSLALCGCLFGNSEESKDSSGYLQSSEPYVQVGNSIALQSKGPDTVRWCDGDRLFSETHPALEGDTLRFELKQDSLFIIHYTMYAIGEAGMENYSVYVKKAGGAGLEGTWIWKGDAFRLTNNTLIPEEKAFYDSVTEASRAEALAYPVTLEFTGTSYKTYVTKTPADEFMEAWANGGGSGMAGWFNKEIFEITLRKLDATTIEVKGAKTGSAFVKLGLNSAGDVTFSSSDRNQTPETFYANPRSCPNEEFPDWVGDFLYANLTDDLPV